MKVGLLSGSIRSASYNTMLLQAIEQRLPSEVSSVWISIDSLPYFNQEKDTPSTVDPVVTALRKQVEECSVLFIATPEYNHSTSGVLKNALDWLSRPYQQGALRGKKVVLLGASISRYGVARVLVHLREVLLVCGAEIDREFEINIPFASTAFADDGSLLDTAIANLLDDAIPRLVSWASA